MNSINNTLNGLASSLFLNVGFTSVAEKFDPMQNQNGTPFGEMVAAQTCEACTMQCNFSPETGQ